MAAHVNWVFVPAEGVDAVFRWNQNGNGPNPPPTAPGTHKRLYHNFLFYDGLQSGLVWQNAGSIESVQGETEVQGRGSWDAFRQKKKKRGTFIRRSDFESIEAYKESLAKLFPVEPKTQIIEPVSPLDDVDDDEILLIAISRLLH